MLNIFFRKIFKIFKFSDLAAFLRKNFQNIAINFTGMVDKDSMLLVN